MKRLFNIALVIFLILLQTGCNMLEPEDDAAINFESILNSMRSLDVEVSYFGSYEVDFDNRIRIWIFDHIPSSDDEDFLFKDDSARETFTCSFNRNVPSPCYVLVFLDANNNLILDSGEPYEYYNSKDDPVNATEINIPDSIIVSFDNTYTK